MRLLFILFVIYFICTLISQQRTLNSYAAEKKQSQNAINEAKEEKETLTSQLDNLNSTNYIESVARNELDMYLPNERVYIDVTK